MKHKYEKPELYNTTFSRTGEKVTLHRRWCKCGHSVNFLSRNPMLCHHCGNLVYPDDRFEFEAKLKKQLKKKSDGNE